MNPSITNKPPVNTPTERVHLEDYWRVVRRRGWLILLTTAVALFAAAWAASRSPQMYRTQLTLQVGDPRGRMGQLGDIDVSPNMLWTDPVESEVQQLTTQSVARYVVESLQLRVETPGTTRDLLFEDLRVDADAPAGDYRLRVAASGAVVLEGEPGTGPVSGQVGIPITFAGGELVVLQTAAPQDYDLRILPQLAAEARVRGGLAASTRPETNLIDVTYTGADRQLAPQILNEVGAALRDLGVRRVREWAWSRTEFIRDRLAEAGLDLQMALKAVESYKRQRGVTSLTSEESRVLFRIRDVETELEQLLIQRSIYNSLINRNNLAGLGAAELQQIATHSATERNQAVQFYFDRLLALLEQRGNQVGPGGMDASHPAIVALDRRIAQVGQDLLSASENAATGLEVRILALTESLDGLQGELRRLPSLETDLARLENQVEINNDMYKYLLSRYQESEIAQAEISPYVDILDPASWAWPVSGGRRMNIVLGGLIGLLLGLGAAFFLEYLDRSIRSTTDVESVLGLAVLGWIPRIQSDGNGQRLSLVVSGDPDGHAAEAYRVLRTNLAFSTAREEQLGSLLFTSPGPAEGKSTTVANLAAVLAARGDRTLLIDADLRRGALHETFDILREPGLSELMVGALDAREVIRPDVCRGLDLLPAGKRPPNPSELLGSRAMAEMLDSWRDEYRWILLDAPPVLAVTDAAVLAGFSDGAVLILKVGETDRRAGWRAVQQLRRVNARVVGAVLNEIEPRRSADGYYLDYYNSGP